ncbi:ATP-binding protein [Kitasatospora indigofera]|uniref:ATP-binding protein n=1 Tax=Kitasatospora indigofera TaxID=67307 RepID=A0A919L0I2_9ACTN|nr:ATP-binding protein [Kitasatospora indigofera]GHH80350.1 ATP-binding protein [Kitasatospora indigofera]
MYVTRVQLRDIKSFSGERAVDLSLSGRSGWTVLAGRNASGKSTVLQAIALAISGPDVSRTLMPDFAGWVNERARKGEVEVHVTADPQLDQFIGRGQKPSEFSVGLQWTRHSFDREDQGVAVLEPLITTMGGPRGPWAPGASGWFCAGYGPFRRLGSSESRRFKNQGPSGRLVTLFREDAVLTEGVSWLIDLRLRQFEEEERKRIAEEHSGESPVVAGPLLRTVLQLLRDDLLPDRYQIQRVTADGLWVSDGQKVRGKGFPLREMSDGYRSVVALVLDIVRQLHNAYGRLRIGSTENGGMAIMLPGVVLIDEIDAHMHVSWQRKIGGWLREHFPMIQFIVTSHSPYICQAADEGGLIRLPAINELQAPAVVDEDLYRRVVYGSGDDAVLSELFGVETPYSSRAEQQRRRLVALERKVYAGTSSSAEQAEYQELAKLLTSSLSSRVAEVSARLEQDQ